MKTTDKITLYTVEMDGVYSTVGKVEVNKSTGELWLKSKSETYFRTFGEAKKHLIKTVEYFLKEWKSCLNRVKSISKNELYK